MSKTQRECTKKYMYIFTLIFLSLLSLFPHQTMDGEMYKCAQNVCVRYAQTEVDAAAFMKVYFEDLRDQASLVGRMMHVYVHRDTTNIHTRM